MTYELFPETVIKRPLPAVNIRSADFSECRDYRWTLKRTWRAGPYVCFIGLNPSTADALQDDPTVLRWTRFADAWGYGGFIAVNLYPYRSPHPKDLRAWAEYERNGPDYSARDAMWRNRDIVAREAKSAALIVACWGAGAAWNDQAEYHIDNVIEEIVTGEEPWPDYIHCFGKTKSGAPIHPMARGKHRVPDDQEPILWRNFKH